MFFISRGKDNDFLDPFHQRIIWRIKNPLEIDWETELFIVEETLKSLTSQQIRIAQYWGTGELTAKITTLIFNLAEKYMLGSPSVARVLSYFHAAMNDTFVITWFFKISLGCCMSKSIWQRSVYCAFYPLVFQLTLLHTQQWQVVQRQY
ncbi:hypothetical protein RCO48_39785 [Peribacillus frigoritolerans]|nr:hypothetical protein [Peribacillus frigoritolerans]